MLMTFAVQSWASMTAFDTVKLVTVDAVTTWRGKRQAAFKVRKSIPNPIVLKERDAAEIIFEAVQRSQRHMPKNLNGNGVPVSKQKERVPLYDAK